MTDWIIALTMVSSLQFSIIDISRNAEDFCHNKFWDAILFMNQVRINQRFNENICMRQSSMISMAISNIRRDLLGQPLQLLSGVDILGNASSALGHMSKGVAALSMDKKFIQSRQRQVLYRQLFCTFFTWFSSFKSDRNIVRGILIFKPKHIYLVTILLTCILPGWGYYMVVYLMFKLTHLFTHDHYVSDYCDPASRNPLKTKNRRTFYAGLDIWM